jgi:hypothetical protein
LFDGDLTTGVLDPKKSDAMLTKLKNMGVDGETSGTIIQQLENARSEFARLSKLTQGKGRNELTDILKDRIKNYTGNTYRIFKKYNYTFKWTKNLYQKR